MPSRRTPPALLYVADTGNNRVRKLLRPTTNSSTYLKIATVAGNGADYNTATEGGVPVVSPSGLLLDQQGNLFIPLSNYVLRVDAETGRAFSIPVCSGQYCSTSPMIVDDNGNLVFFNGNNQSLSRTNAVTGTTTLLLSGGGCSGGVSASPIGCGVYTSRDTPDGNLIASGASAYRLWI